MPMRGRGRYLPSPLRKEFPLVPQNAPQYYSVQEHAVYHHQNPAPNNRYLLYLLSICMFYSKTKSPFVLVKLNIIYFLSNQFITI